MELLIFVVIAWVVLVPIFAVVAFVKVLNFGRRVGAREEYAEQRFRQLELRAEGIALDVEQLKRGVPRAPTPETARAPEPEPAATPVVAAQEPVAVAAPPVEPAPEPSAPEPSAPGPAVEEPAEAATATAAATVAASERASRLAHAASWRGTGDGTPPPPPPFRTPAPAGPPHQSLEMLDMRKRFDHEPGIQAVFQIGDKGRKDRFEMPLRCRQTAFRRRRTDAAECVQ